MESDPEIEVEPTDNVMNTDHLYSDQEMDTESIKQFPDEMDTGP